MRIAMISPTIGDAFGQERVLRDSSWLLRQAGHQVFFIADHSQGQLPQGDGYSLISGLSQLSWRSSPFLVRDLCDRFRSALENFRPDVIHLIDQFDHRLMKVAVEAFPTVMTSHTVATTCPSSTRHIRFVGLCQKASGWGCLAHQKRYQCLDHFRGDLRRAETIFQFRQRKKVLRQVHSMIAISQFVQRCLTTDGWPIEKTPIVYNPIETTNEVFPRKHNTIVCASRLVAHKGIDLLINALKLIERLDWQAWVCGEGIERERCIELAHSLGIKSRIRFAGKLPYSEMAKLVQESALLVQPNLGPEPFGLSVAEASAMGKPVVVSKTGALEEIVEHERNGLLFQPGEVGELADCLERVLQDQNLAIRLGQKGIAMMSERFSPETHLRQTLSVYQQSLTPRSQPESAKLRSLEPLAQLET